VTPPAVAVVGGGRVGLTVARALVVAGHPVTVLSRRARPLDPPLAPAVDAWEPPLAGAAVVLLAVPDAQVTPVAERLAATGALGAAHVVLHLSGLLDRRALAPLASCGAALGSWHPLQTFRDDEGTLQGVPAVVEGDPAARAAAHDLAVAVGMTPVLEIGAQAKPTYHAAAVFASNYLVVLAAIAERLGREAGLATSWRLFLPLMRRTLEYLEHHDPAASLTGPIRRGDVGTVETHLQALEPDVARLYAALAAEALRLAEPELTVEQVEALRGVIGSPHA
jgi:predicted short-subunit dehydrogenase-like oxidoreductase (DUF2520 family)